MNQSNKEPVSRADLLRLIGAQSDTTQEAIALLVGFEKRVRAQTPVEPVGEMPVQRFDPPDDPIVQPVAPPSSRARFLRAVRHERLDSSETNTGPTWWREAIPIGELQDDIQAGDIEVESNVNWPRMQVFLRRQLLHPVKTRRLDERRLVRILARSETLKRLPRKVRMRWPESLVVIEDRSDALYPVWEDYVRLRTRLSNLLGNTVVSVNLSMDSASDLGAFVNTLARARITRERLARGRCLLLSDFGAASQPMTGATYSARTEAWLPRLQWLRKMSSPTPLLALSNIPPSEHPAPVGTLVDLVYWDRHHLLRVGTGSPRHQEDRLQIKRVDPLIAMLSMTAEARPGLLRTLRQLCGEANAIWCELVAWNHPDVLYRLPACFVHPDKVVQWQEYFQNDLSDFQKQQSLSYIEMEHRGARRFVRDHDAVLHHAFKKNEAFGADYIASLMREVVTSTTDDNPERQRQLLWSERLINATHPDFRDHNEQLGALAYLVDAERSKTGEIGPRSTTQRFEYLYADVPIQHLCIHQHGEALCLAPQERTSDSGSPVIDIETHDGLVEWMGDETVSGDFGWKVHQPGPSNGEKTTTDYGSTVESLTGLLSVYAGLKRVNLQWAHQETNQSGRTVKLSTM